MRYVYPAIFMKDEDGDCKVLFPDLDLTTDGKVMEEAFMLKNMIWITIFLQILKLASKKIISLMLLCL